MNNKILADLNKKDETVIKFNKGLNKETLKKFNDLANNYKIVINDLKAVFEEDETKLKEKFK